MSILKIIELSDLLSKLHSIQNEYVYKCKVESQEEREEGSKFLSNLFEAENILSDMMFKRACLLRQEKKEEKS